MKHSDSRMYSGTPCDACGGPTLVLNRGSIWCPAEDPHPGGHFVTRVAFERTPAKQAAAEARKGKSVTQQLVEQANRDNQQANRDWPKPKPVKPVASPFGGGMDDFVRSEDR